MKRQPLQTRTLSLLAVLVPLLALFGYVALRSGPLAPVPVGTAAVVERSIAPGLFGIGTVEARYRYRIGPTAPGRLKHLTVDVGDTVTAGQFLGEMDPVDLDDRLRAQQAALQSAEARTREAEARHEYAQSQARRYEPLLAARAVSEEIVVGKRSELRIATAALNGAREELARLQAELEALHAQRGHLRLEAPVAGLVAAREIDPGTTVVAGQPVLELIDPQNLWIHVRFDQINARGLAAGLPARVLLRSREKVLSGTVLRLEPLADAVTEELLAKVVFATPPDPLPPLGELAEVTIELPPLPAALAIPNAAIQRRNGQLGVWRIAGERPEFVPVELGAADLEGWVQVRRGLKTGDRIVVHSHVPLSPRSRVKEVENLLEIRS
ncbi:efflux RND transporter periplasmic adaptor subunit [Trichloromonas sp.]|uniref:efflux RND transporter periplasmic adaptor subunit n=1 Tax=Trichloromonas sp. TaxID=3069249 RepID=UPI002A3E31B4|nr:efflux RND transporter periplasmic adaptor subunit [Trichloromonas sp.]